MKTKTSYGIALCRNNVNNLNSVEVILIKKRYSYYYLSLIMGHYKKNDEKYIKHLLSNMSFAEKIDIIGMNFSQMWYRIWLNIPEKYFNLVDVYKTANYNNDNIQNKYSNAEVYKLYIQKKNCFEKNFTQDGGKKLRSLIQQSSDSEILWEMPKGGKHGLETDIDCAIREFYEETNIKPNKYEILYDVTPVIDSFVDNETIYKSVYYIATLINKKIEFIPKINFRNFDQISEIEQIRWIGLNEIKFFNLPKTTHTRLVYMCKNVIEKFKRHNKFKKLNI